MAMIVEVTDFSAPELDVFARLTEGQLRARQTPEKGLFIAESPKVIERALNAGYEPVALLMERKHIEGQAREIIARCGDIPLYTADREVLANLTGYELTRGVLCAIFWENTAHRESGSSGVRYGRSSRYSRQQPRNASSTSRRV